LVPAARLQPVKDVSGKLVRSLEWRRRILRQLELAEKADTFRGLFDEPEGRMMRYIRDTSLNRGSFLGHLAFIPQGRFSWGAVSVLAAPICDRED